MRHVDVYGGYHSPWVQAVLLGLHDAGIDHSLRSLPPLDTFLKSGVAMPAASIDGGPWKLESGDILADLGFDPLKAEENTLLRSAWRGVFHRPDSAALFWGGFSLAGDRNPSLLRRLACNFLRSFVTLYFYLLIKFAVRFSGARDPENFADQFMPFESMLADSGDPYLCGDAPNTLDYQLFGILQCHCSIYVPPVAALQSDPGLEKLRAWIGTMQQRFSNYDYLYSGQYFAPHSPPPVRASGLDRVAFWLGALAMIALFPITVPLVAFLAVRNRRRVSAAKSGD